MLYWSVWNDTAPGTYAGVSHIEIPLPDGYTAKDWTVQLRWPFELEKIQCFSAAMRMKDCDGAGCTKMHYHITPHFWDAIKDDQILVEMMPSWHEDDYLPQEFNDGPLACIDWCDNGEVPEWRGPCTTTGGTPAPPTQSTISPDDCDANCYSDFFDCMDKCAGNSACSSQCSSDHYQCVTNCHDPDYVPPTTTTEATTTTTTPEDCDANCYTEFFDCMNNCAGDSICSSECSRIHFECVTICHDPDYVPPTTTTTKEPTTTKPTTTKNPILICDNNCYEDHDRCVANCRRHDEECIELCHIENTQCLAKCHDPDFVPSTPKPTTTTIRTTTTMTSTTTTTTTTTEFDVAACDDACYDEYFKCLAACGYKISDISDLPDIDQMDQCSNDCNNANFECMIECHDH